MFTVLLISADRYVAVRWPHSYRCMRNSWWELWQTVRSILPIKNGYICPLPKQFEGKLRTNISFKSETLIQKYQHDIFWNTRKYFRTGPVMAVVMIWLYSLGASVFIVATTDQYTYNPQNKVCLLDVVKLSRARVARPPRAGRREKGLQRVSKVYCLLEHYPPC